MPTLKFSGRGLGDQIRLSEDRLVARREAGFCDAVVVSSGPIAPGQVLAIEIVETESGWSGDLRIGFTRLPSTELFPLPSFAIPSLVQRGSTWMCAISRTLQTMYSPISIPLSETMYAENEQSEDVQSCMCWLRTSFGSIPLSQLMPETGYSGVPLATDKGSLVCVYYELESSFLNFYLIVNGVQLGCWHTVNIPEDRWSWQQRPLRAVVDVYGVTKAVRLVDIYQVISLESLSEQAVLHCLQSESSPTSRDSCCCSTTQRCLGGLPLVEVIDRLPLPPVIRHKLQRKNQLVAGVGVLSKFLVK